jgi:hypothetical protein
VCCLQLLPRALFGILIQTIITMNQAASLLRRRIQHGQHGLEPTVPCSRRVWVCSWAGGACGLEPNQIRQLPVSACLFVQLGVHVGAKTVVPVAISAQCAASQILLFCNAAHCFRAHWQVHALVSDAMLIKTNALLNCNRYLGGSSVNWQSLPEDNWNSAHYR